MGSAVRNLKEARRLHRLSQDEAASIMGVTQGTISRWERGKQRPDMNALIRLAVALGLEDVSGFALGEDEAIPVAADYVEGVPIVGGIAEARWREGPKWENEFWRDIHLPLPWEWRAYRMQAYVIEDDSADYHFKKGSVAVVALFDSNKLKPQVGDLIVYAERSVEGLYSVTIREYLISAATPERVFLTATSRVGGRSIEVGSGEVERAADARSLNASGFLGLVVASMSILAPVDRLPPRERRLTLPRPPMQKPIDMHE